MERADLDYIADRIADRIIPSVLEMVKEKFSEPSPSKWLTMKEALSFSKIKSQTTLMKYHKEGLFHGKKLENGGSRYLGS